MHLIVLFPGALGDLCLLAPALAALSAGGARVELSLQRSVAPVAAMLLPTAILGPPIDGAFLAALFADEMTPALGAWLQGADQVHAWLARGDVDGRLSARLGELGVVAFMHAVPRSDGELHVGAEYATALGLAARQTPPRAMPAATSINMPWQKSGSTRMVVHPGAGARAKCWAADGFRRVGDAWVAEGGEAVVLLGPADEADAGWWQTVGYKPVMDLAIIAAATLIASAPIWIGNDSGMSHLAGALGRRGVVLFGPTRPQRWRPLGGRLVTIEFLGRSVAAVTREALAILRPLPKAHTPP